MRCLIAICLLFSCLWAKGQTYHHLLETTCWYERAIGLLGPFFITYYQDGDSTFNGHTYKIIKVVEDTSGIHFIREDTIAKQVFMQWDWDTNEALIYDFSVPVGGQYTFRNVGGIYVTATLNNIDTILTLAGNRRRYHYSIGSTGNFTVIEGVGSTEMALGVVSLLMHPTFDLICNHEGNQQVYSNGSFACIGSCFTKASLSHVFICPYDSIYLAGAWRDSAGTYIDTIPISGGDSLVYTVLHITNINVQAGPDISICLGNSVTLTATGAQTYSWDNGVSNGVPFYPNSSDTFTVIGTKGFCSQEDSVFIEVYPTDSVLQNITDCDSAIINGTAYYSSQIVIDNLMNTNGCDSVVTTNLTINNSTNITVDTTLLFGGSITVGTSTYDSSGTYYDTLSTTEGCDSIVIANLTVLSGIGDAGMGAGSIRVVPNPFTHSFTVRVSSTKSQVLSIRVINTLGQEQDIIQQLTTNNQLTIDASAWPSGIYVLHINGNTAKLLKQ